MASVDKDDDRWAMYKMAKDTDTAFGTAIVVTVLSVVLLLLWIIPLGYCLWSHYWIAARWTPISAPEAPRRQVEGESRQPRYCTHCNIFMGDRTYHCQAVEKCLPFYDHTCIWWTGAIWLHNVKAYLVFITFLPLYQLYILGISLWVRFSPHWHGNAYMSVFFATSVTLLISGGVLLIRVMQLIVWNILQNEIDHGIWFTTDEGDVRFWDPNIDLPSTNPWNQGWWQNLRAIFGNRLKDTIECSHQGEMPSPPRSLDVANRRSNVSSTGFEDGIELGNLVRRSQSSA